MQTLVIGLNISGEAPIDVESIDYSQIFLPDRQTELKVPDFMKNWKKSVIARMMAVYR